MNNNCLFAVQFHPSLPILLTGSEDCTVRIWHANTYRLQNSVNYGLDRVWCIAAQKGSNNICIGYDEGSVMIKVLKAMFYLFKLFMVLLIVFKIFFFLHFNCLCTCSWVEKSPPCRWTLVARWCLLGMRRCSRLTSKQLLMPRQTFRMGRGFPWQSRTWAPVIFTRRPFSTTQMDGENSIIRPCHSGMNIAILSFELIFFCVC